MFIWEGKAARAGNLPPLPLVLDVGLGSGTMPECLVPIDASPGTLLAPYTHAYLEGIKGSVCMCVCVCAYMHT